MIYLGIVNVEPIEGNNDLEDAIGAFVNVAYRVDDEKSFIQTVTESFNKYGFKVLDIDDIENEKGLSINDSESAEKLKLIAEIKNGSDLAWGNFHTYMSE